MPHIDSAPEGGKFRAFVSAGMDGVGGAWGAGDLINVAFDTGGYLVTAGAADPVGVVWTPEGRRNTEAATDKNLIGGRKYTVFHHAELVEMGDATTPSFVAGDKVWAKANGTVGTSETAGDVFLGQIDHSGHRLILAVRLLPDAS